MPNNVVQHSFDPEKWLQLGISGALAFILLIALFMFGRALSQARKAHSESDARWSSTVDKIANRQDETQKQTNTILSDLKDVMTRVEVKVDDRRHYDTERRKDRV